MSRTHPLFDVNDVLNAALSALYLIRHLSVGVGLLSALQVAPKVLQKCHFLLQLLGIFC